MDEFVMWSPSFNPSWLKDAVDRLLIYYTPDNVIRKIQGDAIYGNPPFKT